jgi:hypothetical protein
MLSEEMRRVLVDFVHNFSRYHGLPRLRPKKSQPTRGRGTPRKWIRRTTAMAAGITDHRRTMWELMEYQIDNQITLSRDAIESGITKLFQAPQENVGKWIKAIHNDGTFYNAGAITRIRKKMSLTEKIKIRTIEEDGNEEVHETPG